MSGLIVEQSAITLLEGDSIRINENGLLSVFDIIRVVCGQKNPYQVWKRLKQEFEADLTNCENWKFPGERQRNTPVVDKKTALKIIGLLPGLAGRKYREVTARLLVEYLEAPDQLAKRAIDRIEDKEKLAQVKQHVTYRQSYHGVHNELKRHNSEDIHHATLNKYNNELVGLNNGDRPSMSKRSRALLAAIQSLQEVTLIDKEVTHAWSAVNAAKSTGNKIAKMIEPAQEK